MTGEEIIDFCLDNKDLNEEELNEKLLEKLEDFGPYNHSSSETIDACNLSTSKYANKGFLLPPDDLFVKNSMLVEFYEKALTKRELSYFYVQSLSMLNELLKHKTALI